MSDMIADGITWLNTQRAAHLSQTVTYRRGDNEHELTATRGRTEYEMADEYGLVLGAHMVDFLILAADFPVVFDEPTAGDLLIVDSVQFEALAFGGDRCWRWSDPERTLMRIHTREVGSD